MAGGVGGTDGRRGDPPRPTRVDVVSDTHGYLSPELLEALKGADVIVHAGDICSRSDLEQLRGIAPVHLCLGNNDWGYDYGPTVGKVVRFSVGGLRWELAHHRELLDTATCDVAICGHTHRACVERTSDGCLVMNPGSPTYPRSGAGPTIGRVIVGDGRVASAEIVSLVAAHGGEGSGKKEHRRWWQR